MRKRIALATIPVLAVIAAAIAVGVALRETGVRADAPTEEEREAMRQEAIKHKNPELLPVCREEDMNTPPAEYKPSPESVWDAVDCQTPAPKGDEIKRGPGGAPGAGGHHDGRWHVGIYRQPGSASEYDRGIKAVMPIVNPVMDMNATNNFYAHRMMIIGTNDHSLEAGWYEATWSNGTQVIYYQDSHSCNSQDCEWMGRNTPCNRSRGIAETRLISYGSTNKWAAWCYTGSVWRTMINNMNLGNLNAWEIEAAGEVYITNQTFDTTLPGDGAKFEDLRLQNDNTLWYPWDTFISTSHFNDGGPYETDFVHNYYEFYVDETP